jgi:hypothetical protein
MSFIETSVHDVAVEGGLAAVEELIARVLCRAHRMAEELGSPGEARAVFHLAHSFADELAVVDPQFDRIAFIETATAAAS